MKFKVNEITTLAIFAALWGAIEITLGTFLHVMRAPFIGALLAGIGAFIMLIARSAVNKKGTTLLIGFIVALIKLLSVGGSKLLPAMCIFMEAALVEVLLSVMSLSLLSFCVSAAATTMLTVLQVYINTVIVSGKGIGFFIDGIKHNFEQLGIGFKGVFSAFVFIVMSKLMVCFALGMFIGAIAWKMTGRLSKLGNRG